MGTETTETENKGVEYAIKAFKQASSAFAGATWVNDYTQDSNTLAAAREKIDAVNARGSAKQLSAKKISGEAQQAAGAPAAQELSQDAQPGDIVVDGATGYASPDDLADDIAVCWDMAEQLEDDMQDITDAELSATVKKAIDLLKAAKTPEEASRAKFFAKMAKVAAESGGAAEGELTLEQKMELLNTMYVAAQKSNEAALKHIEVVDKIREENPDLLSKEGWEVYDSWKEKASKRQEEADARIKAREEEWNAAKTDAERIAVANKYLKLELEATERAKKEDEAYREMLAEEVKRIEKTGTEQEKQALHKWQDSHKEYQVASKDRDEVSEEVKAALGNSKTGFVAAEKGESVAESVTKVAVLTRAGRFLETQAEALEFMHAAQDVKKEDEAYLLMLGEEAKRIEKAGVVQTKTKENASKSQEAGDDLLADLGAPVGEKVAKIQQQAKKPETDMAVAKTKAGATNTLEVGADLLGDLGAPTGGKGAKVTKTQTRIG